MARATPRVRFPWLLAFLLTATSVWAVPHRASSRLRDQIESLEEQWRQAVLSNDTDRMEKLLAEDFLGITGSGQVVTKLQQIDRMRSHQLELSRLDVSDTKIKLIGAHAAIVTSLAQVEGSSDGRPIHGSFRYLRVYRRLPNGSWKITSFEATHIPRRLAESAHQEQPGP